MSHLSDLPRQTLMSNSLDIPLQTLMSNSLDLPQQTPALLSWIFGELLDNQADYIPIFCKDGKRYETSCLLLAVLSPFAAQLMKNTDIDVEDTVIIMPDIEINALNIFYQNIYTLMESDAKNQQLTNLAYDDLILSLFSTTVTAELEESIHEVLVKEEPYEENKSAKLNECFVTLHRIKSDDILIAKSNAKVKRKAVRKRKESSDVKQLKKSSKPVLKEVKIEKAIAESPSPRKRARINYAENNEDSIENHDDFCDSTIDDKDDDSEPSADDKHFDFDEKENEGLEVGKTKKKRGIRTKGAVNKEFQVITEDNLPKDEAFLKTQEDLKSALTDENLDIEPRRYWSKIFNYPKFDKDTKLICPLCLYAFPYQKNGFLYFKHIQKHKMDHFKCSCEIDRKAMSKPEWHDHVKKVHWHWHQCPWCTDVLDPDKYEHHIQHKHQDKHQKVSCQHCGKKFPTNTGFKYRVHMANHLAETFDCDCPITFDSRKHKMHHIQVHHLKEMIGCSQCHFVATTQEQMERHVRKAHQKPVLAEHKSEIICDICGQQFKQQFSLVRHTQLMHEGTPQDCPQCGKTLRNNFALADHIRLSHNRGGVCNVCGMQVTELRRHMKNNHVPKHLKRYKCDDCDKRFNYTALLQKHRMNVHLKLRPYKCRYGCEFAYNDSSNRNQHEKKKHGGLYSAKALDVIKDE